VDQSVADWAEEVNRHAVLVTDSNMKPVRPLLATLLLAPLLALHAANDGITWLVRYDGKSLPASPWALMGKANATVEDGALHLSDDSKDESGAFEAEWKGDLEGQEIIVEARVKLVSMVGHRDSPTATWPQRDGAPICIQISDGKHEEGILLTPAQDKHAEAAKGYVRTLTDRFAQADTRDAFHTYRLIIRGEDMAVEMDDKRIIEGRDAFWRPATSPRQFIRFGSTSKPFTGEAQWEFVRLGLRPAMRAAVEKSPLKITISEPWPLNVETKNTESRPYLYDMGQGLLLTSNPQGSDALLEPYIVRRSTDAGKTWQAVTGTEQNSDSPQELVRLADGRIFGPSRWTRLQPDGTLTGKTTILDAKAETFAMHDSTITLPTEFMPAKAGEVLLFERHIWAEKDGSITAVAWSRRATLKLPNGRGFPERHTHLLRSTDLGKTWTHVAHVGLGGEPAVVRLSESEWLAITRPDAHMSNLLQHRSLDGGRTWTFERTLEEGSVMPDLVLMSHGVLACSYGRPVSNLMFSLDGGRTWRDHRVISDRANFNYTAIREISPGRLLYMHDGQIPGTLARINSLYIDVEKTKK
jgi:hypothetical protein